MPITVMRSEEEILYLFRDEATGMLAKRKSDQNALDRCETCTIAEQFTYTRRQQHPGKFPVHEMFIEIKDGFETQITDEDIQRLFQLREELILGTPAEGHLKLDQRERQNLCEVCVAWLEAGYKGVCKKFSEEEWFE